MPPPFKLASYIAQRPGVEKLGSHGLFAQPDEKIDLDAVAQEVNDYKGYRLHPYKNVPIRGTWNENAPKNSIPKKSCPACGYPC